MARLFSKLIKYVLRAIKNEIFDRRSLRVRRCCTVLPMTISARVDLSKIDRTMTLAYDRFINRRIRYRRQNRTRVHFARVCDVVPGPVSFVLRPKSNYDRTITFAPLNKDGK